MSRRDLIEYDHYTATHGERFNDEHPTRREAERDERRHDDIDPLWQILNLVGNGGEELARLAYGDATVDGAVARVLDEEGL